MVTINVKVHIDKKMVDWICEREKCGLQGAVKWLELQYESGMADYEQWHVPAWDPELQLLEMIHADQAATGKAEGGEVWEG